MLLERVELTVDILPFKAFTSLDSVELSEDILPERVDMLLERVELTVDIDLFTAAYSIDKVPESLLILLFSIVTFESNWLSILL